MISNQKTAYRIFAVTFLAVLALLLFGEAVVPDRDYSSAEKRVLSSFPRLSAERLSSGNFMKGIEDYAQDQFPGRDVLMKLKTGLLRLAGQNESQGVVYMKDGSFAERFAAPEKTRTEETVSELERFYERNDSLRHYFLLAPTAVNINAGLLPAFSLTDDQNEYMDGFFAALPEGMERVDVRRAFRESGENLYYRTDHHWTTEGAEIASDELLTAMGITERVAFESGVVTNSFVGSLAAKSGFTPKEADAITVYREKESVPYTVSYETEHVLTASVYEAEELSSDDPYRVFFGGNHPLITITTPNIAGRSLLVFKDSYANALIPFLIPYFKTITVVDPRYYGEDIDLLVSENSFTDVLYLYNANTLSADSSLAAVLRNDQ